MKDFEFFFPKSDQKCPFLPAKLAHFCPFWATFFGRKCQKKPKIGRKKCQKLARKKCQKKPKIGRKNAKKWPGKNAKKMPKFEQIQFIRPSMNCLHASCANKLKRFNLTGKKDDQNKSIFGTLNNYEMSMNHG